MTVGQVNHSSRFSARRRRVGKAGQELEAKAQFCLDSHAWFDYSPPFFAADDASQGGPGSRSGPDWQGPARLAGSIP